MSVECRTLGGENQLRKFVLGPKMRTDTEKYKKKELRTEYKHCLIKPSLKGRELSGRGEKIDKMQLKRICYGAELRI